VRAPYDVGRLWGVPFQYLERVPELGINAPRGWVVTKRRGWWVQLSRELEVECDEKGRIVGGADADVQRRLYAAADNLGGRGEYRLSDEVLAEAAPLW